MGIIGSIIGDIAGSRWEFERCSNPNSCKLFTNYNGFTDDTVMSIAVKKIIDNPNTDPVNIMQNIGLKYPYCGYGNMFDEWLHSSAPHPYMSYGNGAAMRVSYIGTYYNDLKTVTKKAGQIASITHNHPEGIKGASITAGCVWMAKNGYSKDDIYKYMCKYYPSEDYKYSNKPIRWLKRFYKWDVSCMGSVPVAIQCFYESEDYESFIRNVLSLDCDADTLCAIGGGIAEEYYKETGFDNNEILEEYLDDYLMDILNK